MLSLNDPRYLAMLIHKLGGRVTFSPKELREFPSNIALSMQSDSITGLTLMVDLPSGWSYSTDIIDVEEIVEADVLELLPGDSSEDTDSQ
jgi:hypothetical protein